LGVVNVQFQKTCGGWGGKTYKSLGFVGEIYGGNIKKKRRKTKRTGGSAIPLLLGNNSFAIFFRTSLRAREWEKLKGEVRQEATKKNSPVAENIFQLGKGGVFSKIGSKMGGGK